MKRQRNEETTTQQTKRTKLERASNKLIITGSIKTKHYSTPKPKVHRRSRSMNLKVQSLLKPIPEWSKYNDKRKSKSQKKSKSKKLITLKNTSFSSFKLKQRENETFERIKQERKMKELEKAMEEKTNTKQATQFHHRKIFIGKPFIPKMSTEVTIPVSPKLHTNARAAKKATKSTHENA